MSQQQPHIKTMKQADNSASSQIGRGGGIAQGHRHQKTQKFIPLPYISSIAQQAIEEQKQQLQLAQQRSRIHIELNKIRDAHTEFHSFIKSFLDRMDQYKTKDDLRRQKEKFDEDLKKKIIKKYAKFHKPLLKQDRRRKRLIAEYIEQHKQKMDDK